MARTFGWLALLLVASGPVLAQRAYVAIEQRLSAQQLHDIGLTTAQLDLLNRYLRDAEHGASPVEAAPRETRAEEASRDPGRFIGFESGRIPGKVKGRVAGWEPGTVFELENGQQWKVLKGSMTLHRPLQDPRIVLVPGLAGRWFLQVDEDTPKARVYRID